MLVPARTPATLIEHLYASLARVLGKPVIAERFTAQGLQIFGSTPAQFDRYLRSEVDRWAAVVKAADIRVE
jgi:tripartite-type tricarboxylate transporter receptor subunit TctC